MAIRIDLHIHTTVSDGTDSPREILQRVRDAGIGLFSVTDHDAVKGSLLVKSMLRKGAPLFLTGAEFSCRDEEGKYHILGYGFDPEAESIRKLVETGHSYRMKKIRQRLESLEEKYRIRFPKEEITKLLSLDNPGKPHIGNLMVKYKFAATKDQAIREYIDRIRLKSEWIRPEQAIAAIRGGGGIAVLAHPSYGSGREHITGSDMDRRLRRLTDFGLQGVEAYYCTFPEEIREEMLSFADQYGLYVTAGSDYHGKNKTNRLGDTGLGAAEEWPEGLHRFLEDTGCGEALQAME